MRYQVLVTDYDGTIAHDGRVAAPTLEALERLRRSGRRLVLVTGRSRDELSHAFDRPELFDRLVLENGAVLYDPATREERVLTEAPPERFVAELRRRKVAPLGVGRGIVATWEPNQDVVLDVIREMGLELEIIFNKGAVMVLPTGVNKASGLRAALGSLELSPHNAVAVGDAQNDHAFLAVCEVAVAVANALPMLKERADLVTRSDHGEGVTELIESLVGTDLAEVEPRLGRHHLQIGETADREPVTLAPFGRNVLLAGPSGAGKSTLLTALLEAITEHGYQFCLIDPEGDHAAFSAAVTLGEPGGPPTAEEVLEVLVDPAKNAIVDLVGLPLEERPDFFERLLPRLQEMRTRLGRPHWILIDEAHHLLPASWNPPPDPFPRELGSTLMVVLDPARLSATALNAVDEVVAAGDEPWESFDPFARAADVQPPAHPDMRGDASAAIWRLDGSAAPVAFRPSRPRTERERHKRKYAAGDLPPERSFYFRGPRGKVNLRAQNLQLFVQIADGIDDETWLHHLHAGDYSRWLRDIVKDEELANEVAEVERSDGRDGKPDESRKRIRQAIEERYTASG